MKDFQQQLKDYKNKNFPIKRIEWTDEDVKDLLYKGESKNHPTHANETQLSLLRTPNHSVRNRFIEVIKEYERETGNKVEKVFAKYHYPTKQELELISKHIVPFGMTRETCYRIGTKRDMFASGTRSYWDYETKEEYEARTSVKKETDIVSEPKPELPKPEPVVESFAAEVERQPQTEFELKTEAFKTLFVGGMSVEKISKVLGLDDKVTNAMMVVIDHFKL